MQSKDSLFTHVNACLILFKLDNALSIEMIHIIGFLIHAKTLSLNCLFRPSCRRQGNQIGPAVAKTNSQFTLEMGVDYLNHDIAEHGASSRFQCQSLCLSDPKCLGIVLEPLVGCWLKSSLNLSDKTINPKTLTYRKK